MVRSLLAFDAPKMARYALAAYLLQFAMIMPFYTLLAERSACNRVRCFIECADLSS